MKQTKIRNISDYNAAFSALGVTLYTKKGRTETNGSNVTMHRKETPVDIGYSIPKQLEVF